MSIGNCYQCKEKLQVIKGQPYNYKESGLDNVVLHGINQYKCHKCKDTFVSIPQIEFLHLVIGRNICCQEYLLDGAEIKFLRKELHMKAIDLAKVLGITPATISRWENDKKPIGEVQDRFLRSIYMLYASEQAGQVITRSLQLFSSLPTKRKKLPASSKIELSSVDWMGKLTPEFCPAH